MLMTNEQIVKNLLEIAQKNYELESEIEQLKGDTESFLKVDSTVKETDILDLEDVGGHSDPLIKPRRTTQ
jgi:hypothetical protein